MRPRHLEQCAHYSSPVASFGEDHSNTEREEEPEDEVDPPVPDPVRGEHSQNDQLAWIVNNVEHHGVAPEEAQSGSGGIREAPSGVDDRENTRESERHVDEPLSIERKGKDSPVSLGQMDY
mgnify:CR=1 FL=1